MTTFPPVSETAGRFAAFEELYPGKGSAEGYYISGFAGVSQFPFGNEIPENRSLAAGIRSFGRGNLFVHQSDKMARDPSFDFRPLTGAFLYNAIEFDPTFKFSIISRRIGDVTYVSGAGARDFGGEVNQGMESLHADGGWNKGGLTLSISGELGDHAAFLNKPVLPEYKHRFYRVALHIPWMILRFMFFNEMGFVVDNYHRYGEKEKMR